MQPRYYQPVTTGPTITADSDIDEIKSRIGAGSDEELRQSERRRKYLLKFVRVLSATDADLILQGDMALSTIAEDGTPAIYLPSNEIEQPVTEFSRRVFDILVQETLALHEVGHLLYSDFRTLATVADEFEDQTDRNLFMQVFNCLEDGSIDLQLRREFHSTRDFLILYANLTQRMSVARTVEIGGEDQTIFTFHDAVVTALLDLAVYDSGSLDQLLDSDDETMSFAGGAEDHDLFVSFLPEIEQVVIDVLSEGDPAARIHRVREFFDDYRPVLDSAVIEGISDANSTEAPSRLVAGGISQADADERAKSVSGEPSPARFLPSTDQIEAVVRSDDAETPSSAAGSLDGETTDEFDQVVEGDYQAEVRREAEQASNGLAEEAEVFQDIISAGSDGLNELEVSIPDADLTADTTRWQECERRSVMIEQAFRRRLQHERMSRPKRHQRRGKLSRHHLMDIERGKFRVFERDNDPHEKEYAAMIIQDRSGSMEGDGTEAAEQAVTALAMALESIGVETSIMDFYADTPRIVSPFGSPVEERKDVLLGGESDGGTPLAEAIKLGRTRFDAHSAERPFMIVVTDDAPDDPEAYREELHNCTFPVLGVMLTEHIDLCWRANADDCFHRQVEITDNSQLYKSLQQLAEEVIID